MKRKIFLSVLSLLFVCALVVLTLYLSFPSLFIFDNPEREHKQPQLKTITYPVCKGTITHTYTTDGKVISDAPELYIISYDLQGITETNFELLKQKGDMFVVGDELYRSNNKAKTADCNGKIIDITYSETEKATNVSIKAINYDALFVVTQISQEVYSKIDYSTVATVIFEDAEYEATIKSIGYEVVDNYIQLQLSAPMKALPGSAVKVSIVLDVDTVGLYVPITAIYSNGDEYYAFIKDGDGKSRVELTVGEEFSVEEDGNIFEYIEILSGVSESDILIVEEAEDYSTKLNEALIDE